MRLVLVLLGTCCLFLGGARGQGFVPPPDLTQQNQYRRQLTVAQQTHILNDVQQHQHQHRFNLHNPLQQQEQQYLIQQPSAEIAANPTQQTIINQRPPPVQQQPSNTIRFPQNNYRTNFQSSNTQNSIPLVQHHTQTNFIPNYVQQNQQETQSSNNQFQRSLQNQLQLPSQQVPPANPTQQSKRPIDQEFHAQNFITLRNHYSPPQQVPAQTPPAPNQQFIQAQPQPQPQPQFSSTPQFSTSPQFQNGPPQQIQQFQSGPSQQVQQFQNGPPQQIQQFQNIPASQTIQQQVPTFQPTPVSPNQQYALTQQIDATHQLQQVPPQFQTNQQQVGVTQFQNQQFKAVNQFQQYSSNSGAPALTPDQEAKQKLIQKHEAFVQKQYEKQQSKVKQLHDDFIQKQQSIKDLGLTVRQPIYDRTVSNERSRPLAPSESTLFDFALQKYYEEHPTTTTTTTTSTAATTKVLNINTDDEPIDYLLQGHRKDIYGQLKLESEKIKPPAKRAKDRPKSTKALGRDELLKQLKLALAENPQPSLGNKSFDTMDLVLPNGEKVQVIRTTDPNLIAGANSNRVQLTLPSPSHFPGQSVPQKKSTNRNDADIIKQIAPDYARDLLLSTGEKVEIVPAPVPPSISGLKDLPPDISSLYTQSFGDEAQIISADGPPSIEELSKRGLIPEGYEIVQQPAPGTKPQQTPQPQPAAPKKNPTFVYLEEQPDGSFKIQGVKANGEKETKTSGAEVDSILQRIKQGDIKLPPAVTKIHLPGEEPQIPSTTHRRPLPTTTPTTTTTTTTTPRISYHSTYQSTTPPSYYTGSTPRVTFPSSTVSPYSTLSPIVSTASTQNLVTASSSHETTYAPPVTRAHVSEYVSTEATITDRLIATPPSQRSSQEDLIQILKSNGLFAMAKYLRQSGLDGILNETGPYTVFAPTDKAFKNLLIQLGGPEKAEEKFKANPRLLSGLLLHHVIPGAFEISSLQDEMTGVSLAGTQLRVNQYTMHDQEWNDVLITTINGAMVVNDKQDVKIPQGIVHGVDRVMFPLPVGDLLQTLQSDRENRFTNFLKILYASGLSEILQNKELSALDVAEGVVKEGTKTYTVFAPADKAFSELESEDLQKLLSDKDAAQAFAMRHIVPGTLFSAGMRFYQVKDSLLDGKTITLQKTSTGKIKVNESQMVTSNIPATNGVIHALDGLL